MRVAVADSALPLNFTIDRQVGNSTDSINPGLRLAKDSRSGAVYALWQRCVGNCGGDPKSIEHELNRSDDGGLTWHLNGNAFGTAIATANSTQPTPKFGTVNALLGGVHHAAADPATGDVYYAYANQDAAGNDRMAIRRVTINGAGNVTIGAETIVSALDTALPQVAVDHAGTVAVFYYSFDGFGPPPASLPTFTAHLALSVDQAATFVDRTLLTFQSPSADNGSQRQRVLGDYQQLKSLDDCFYGAFTANGAPLGRPFDNTDVIFFKVCQEDRHGCGGRDRCQ
jgi:hypothetical protein